MLTNVLKKVRHATALVQHALRDLHTNRKRSPRWKQAKAMHLVMEPTCAACRGETRVQVHHIRPFHLQPEMELDLANLISLCMGPNECHLRVGHGGDYKAFNHTVREDSQDVLEARISASEGRVAGKLRDIAKRRLYALLVRSSVMVGGNQTLH